MRFTDVSGVREKKKSTRKTASIDYIRANVHTQSMVMSISISTFGCKEINRCQNDSVWHFDVRNETHTLRICEILGITYISNGMLMRSLSVCNVIASHQCVRNYLYKYNGCASVQHHFHDYISLSLQIFLYFFWFLRSFFMLNLSGWLSAY